jgi:hypothetical protein
MYQNINYHDRQHEQRISAEKLSKNFEALKNFKIFLTNFEASKKLIIYFLSRM